MAGLLSRENEVEDEVELVFFSSDASFARLSSATSRGSFVGSWSGRSSFRVAPHLLLFAFALHSRR
jgi:hypothetical protein